MWTCQATRVQNNTTSVFIQCIFIQIHSYEHNMTHQQFHLALCCKAFCSSIEALRKEWRQEAQG